MNEDILFRVFEGLSVIFETFIVYQYINGLFMKRTESKVVLLSYIVFCFGLSFLSIVVRTPAVLITFTLVGLFALEMLYYDSIVITRIFSVLYFAALMMISEILCSAIVSGLWQFDLSSTLDFGLSRALGILIAKLIQMLAVKLSVLLAKWKKDDADNVDIKFALPIIICQICSIMLAYHVFILCFYTYEEFEITGFLSMTSIIYINIVIFWYFDRIKVAYKYKAISEAMEIKLNLQSEYYQTLAEHQKETFALWHDMKKHIDLMRALNNTQQQGLSVSYLDELQDDLSKRLRIVHTEQPIIGALLSEQLKRADREGVTLDLDIRLGSQMKLSPIDLCVIIGNLFDNAFEACATLEYDKSRWIKAEIKQRNQAVFVRISNPISPAKKVKKSGRHGFGLSNVRKSVNKYAGQFDVGISETEFTATITIP